MALITDATCPHGNAIVKIDQRILSIDADGIRGSYVNNPLRWTQLNEGDPGYTAADDNAALYINTAQHASGESPVALGIHFGRLAVFSRNYLQVWQSDPDPTLWALQETLPVGTRYPYSLANVAGDLLFLSSSGFRSVGYQAEYDNVQELDIGSPVDEEILMNEPDGGYTNVRALYTVKYGQYMCLCQGALDGVDRLYVMTFSKTARVLAWGVYRFHSGLGELLDIQRSADDDVLLLFDKDGEQRVHIFDDMDLADQSPETEGHRDIDSGFATVQNDFAIPGSDKRVMFFDVVAEGDAMYKIVPETQAEEGVPAMLLSGDTRAGPRTPMNMPITTAPKITMRHTAREKLEVKSLQVDYEVLRRS